MRLSRIGYYIISCTILVFCQSVVAQSTEKYPVEYFSRLPLASDVKLSPDGEQLLGAFNFGEETFIAVMPSSGGELKALIKTNNDKFKVDWFEWLNNDYIGLSVWYPARRGHTAVTMTRLLAIAASGESEAFPLVAPNFSRRELDAQFQDDVIAWMRDDPDHILMAINYDSGTAKSVYKVKTNAGKRMMRKRIERSKVNATHWVVDQLDRPRAYVSFEDTTYAVYVADTESDKWRKLWEYESFSKAKVWPIYFADDPNMLYVIADNEGYDAIFLVDVNDPTLSKQLIYAEPGFDVGGGLLISPKTRDLIGAVSKGGQSTYKIWDQRYQPFFTAVDDALPNTTNYLLGLSNDERRYLIYSERSNIPGRFYVGDGEGGSLSLIEAQYPELNDLALPEKKYIKYQARDGLNITGYLTLPLTSAAVSDKKNTDVVAGQPKGLPTIIFPHGGPIVHESLSFDYWTQFFANRGYAVLQMNFRGSSGYGHDFMAAGLKNWGLAMQDDIVDGVDWLVESGVSDKERICIVGASFGGYAALMGLATTPELFQCGISFAGVTDLTRLRQHNAKFLNGQVLNKQIGVDKKQLKRTSPTTLAENITAPLLLIQGDKDRRVPLSQAKVMVKALKKKGVKHQYIEIKNGDHFLTKQQHRTEVFKAMDTFLAEHLPVE